MDDYLKEITDRMRRLETRFTKFMEIQGFDTKVRRPVFRDGVVEIPSMACSIHDILTSIPITWDKGDEVEIRHKEDFVASIFLTPPD